MPRKVMIISLVAVLLGLVALGLALYTARPGGPFSAGVSSGKPLIGGAFELIDHDGKKVTDKDFHGKFTLVYFGFTFCPDICPTELQNIAAALEKIGKARRKHLVPLFITIDPERDTQELMSSYVENFHPDLVGLTGSTAQIAAVAKAYRVYYKKVIEKDAADGYTMDHSALVFLMDDKGRYVSHFAYATAPEKIAQTVMKAIDGRFGGA